MNLLNAGAERVDIQALPGHVNLATIPIYTHVDRDCMAAVVNKLQACHLGRAGTKCRGQGPSQAGCPVSRPAAAVRAQRAAGRGADPVLAASRYGGLPFF